jgi:hypothetical protein
MMLSRVVYGSLRGELCEPSLAYRSLAVLIACLFDIRLERVVGSEYLDDYSTLLL